MKASINVDSYPYLEYNGITVTTYIGDQCGPAVEVFTSYDEMVKQVFESIVMVKDGVPCLQAYREDYDDIDVPYIKEVRDMITGLRVAADRLEQELAAHKVYDQRTGTVRDMTDLDM